MAQETKKEKMQKQWKKMIKKAAKELKKAEQHGTPEEIKHWEFEDMMVTDELSFIDNDDPQWQ